MPAAICGAKRLAAVLIVLQSLLPPILSKCTIDVNQDYGRSSPMILDSGSYDTVYPTRASPSVLSFATGDHKVFYCAGGTMTTGKVRSGRASLAASCVGYRDFIVNTSTSIEQYSFNSISCPENPNPTTRVDPNRRCANDAAVTRIGYQVGPSSFKQTMELCFLKEQATTAWSHSSIPAAIGGNRNHNASTPAFIKGAFFGNVLITKVYPWTSQYQTFLEIFGNDTKLVDEYLPRSATGLKRNYFVKGHLAARADMYYYAEQYSTYFYVNVLPMWLSINNGNWKSVESTVRRIASQQLVGDQLDVWTGGLGVLSLSGRRIYLAKDRGNASKWLLRAPELLFKLVVNGAARQGLVFVTANDPYLAEGAEVPKRYRLCSEYEPCSDKFKRFKQRFEGYTYCCLVEDFFKIDEVKGMQIPVDFKNLTPLPLL